MRDKNGFPVEETQVPPIDVGNLSVMNPGNDIQIAAGFIRMTNGKSVYVMTFRQGVATFTLPFHGGAQSMLQLADMLTEHAKSAERPSGLIVPQVGTPIPDLKWRR